MNLKHFIFFYLLAAILLTSCNPTKNAKKLSYAADNRNITPEIKKSEPKDLNNFPVREGFDRYIIMMGKKTDKNENSRKIEIIPGKTMKVDCNKHWFAGKLEEKTLEGYGYKYYQYIGSTEVASTRKGCLDEILNNEFVKGKSIIASYNGAQPIVVYVPKGMEIKYKIWEAQQLYTPISGSNYENTDKSADSYIKLTRYPKSKDDNEKVVVIHLKQQPENMETTMKIELIPGKNTFVNCNKHGLSGKMIIKEEQQPYEYYIFESNGEIYSTLMQCPDNTKPKNEFVTGESQFVDYNHTYPLVVFLSRKLDLKYRIWITNNALHDALLK